MAQGDLHYDDPLNDAWDEQNDPLSFTTGERGVYTVKEDAPMHYRGERIGYEGQPWYAGTRSFDNLAKKYYQQQRFNQGYVPLLQTKLIPGQLNDQTDLYGEISNRLGDINPVYDKNRTQLDIDKSLLDPNPGTAKLYGDIYNAINRSGQNVQSRSVGNALKTGVNSVAARRLGTSAYDNYMKGAQDKSLLGAKQIIQQRQNAAMDYLGDRIRGNNDTLLNSMGRRSNDMADTQNLSLSLLDFANSSAQRREQLANQYAEQARQQRADAQNNMINASANAFAHIAGAAMERGK